MLTQERLRSILHYDRETGVFTWSDTRNHRIKIGTVAGTVGTDGYRRIRVDGTKYKAHRLVWLYVHGRWPFVTIDHINMDKGDNRLKNLREALRRENAQNRRVRPDNLLGLKGVTRWRDKKRNITRYMARISIDGKRHTLGYFQTPEEAYAAYCAAAKDAHGEFANLGQ